MVGLANQLVQRVVSEGTLLPESICEGRQIPVEVIDARVGLLEWGLFRLEAIPIVIGERSGIAPRVSYRKQVADRIIREFW